MASFSQNKTNKKWSVRFRWVEEGREVNKRLCGFDTKRDAQSAYAKFVTTHECGLKKSKIALLRYDITLNELFDHYRLYIKNRIKESSLYCLECDYAKHIEPIFGNTKIITIDKYVIFDWQKKLDSTDYRHSQKSKLRSYMSKLLQFAVMYYDLPINPCMQVENFRRVNEEKKEMHVWDKAQFNSFIDTVDDVIYNAFFTTLYYTGARKSEVFALGWDDIDFDKNVISINKTLTRKVRDMPYAISCTPKTKSSNRKIAIPQVLLSVLTQYKITCNTRDNFVFGGTAPLAEQTVSRQLKKYIIKHNCSADASNQLPMIHEHEFRHSHASYLISKGASIVSVSKRLGHSNIEETLNTYSHMMPNDDMILTALLDE